MSRSAGVAISKVNAKQASDDRQCAAADDIDAVAGHVVWQCEADVQKAEMSLAPGPPQAMNYGTISAPIPRTR